MTLAPEIFDPSDLPTYSIRDAARYLTIPAGTLRSWLHGRYYPVEGGKRYFEPLIQRPNPSVPQLSFINLVEAHVLRVIRRDYQIRLDKVRIALDYLEREFNLPHPIARAKFNTDGVDLFVESVGRLINASKDGQLVMQQTLQHLLQRVEWDENGIAKKLFLLTRRQTQNNPKVLVIDPRLSFGRPVLVGTGTPTSVMAERYKAGESIDDLAEDYGCDRLQIEEAIRCELFLQQSA
jgi:uncharacterized protein (DUF433 family)